jgi:hypothetical protein
MLVGQMLPAQAESLSWVKVTERAEWQPRDSSGEVVFDGKMWLLGGWFTSHGPCPNDVWNSADGVRWKQITPRAPWIHGDLPTTMVHQNKMWMMGGWAGGRLPGASASNQVWHSTNGADWTQATAKAPWCPRLGAAGVVFQGKMWILGGIERYFDGDKLLADVWSSEDGIHWTNVVDRAPWAARAYHGAVVFRDRIWVFGGGNYVPTYWAANDVWSSPDGRRWTNETDRAAWPARIWFSSLVYKNRMWVLGGWSNQPSKNWNDVWYSSDGKEWKELIAQPVWSPRHEQSAYVLDNKIWIAGGNPWPLTNDVWKIEIPDKWFTRR